ncbi:PBP1A family penicillin-binding protein [Erythrobacteraceae bacterium CFH 75059]|uniref:transglycosylase domain-containing protein n=1 Tax=Qipengyuania thermophila TaxID=2509361 RepID=UPI00101EC750|nr:PBP1A family penicillin-binding protein [Qipengyuania thermophila]TCD06405.1 PBP1A family penicillin-binding protein [Erythrobacteraceae bacterium CFH 75059]
MARGNGTSTTGAARRRMPSRGAPARSARGAAAPRRTGRLRRVFGWLALLAGIAALFTGAAVVFAMRELPSFGELRNAQPGQTIVVRARDGTAVVELGPSYGEWLSSDEIPEVMKHAMIAVEDRRFHYHFGVDPIGLARAVYVWATGERRLGATSTITQQLARNIFLNSNRSIDRKMREAVLAMALEAKFSKEEILELYLNKVYFGGGAWGIDSASRRFFSHPATDLSTGEAAIIAGLVKAPSRYAPSADVEAAVDRARIVLRLMREQGYISPSEASVDVSSIRLKRDTSSNAARYFSDWVLPQLDVLLPETFEPIEVWTTLDANLQNVATRTLRDNVPAGAQGALVALDRDGAVLALVGGTDYVATNYNRATQAVRQPGSAWKLFVYLAALEAGYTPEDRVVDAPVTIGEWTPRNANGRNVGEMSLRSAFAFSTNTVAAQLGNEVGFNTVAAMARRFGITTPISTTPAMVLGTSETRLIDMTQAFAAISAGGQAVQPYGVVRVTTASGDTIYRRESRRVTQLVPDYVAAGITDLLQTTVNTGTGRAAQIGRPVAGKTGTTNSNRDGWFLGFSSGITTGIWMGRDDARPVAGLQGGTAPARAFSQFMRVAVADRPVEPFMTQVQLPEWQLEPDAEYGFGNPDEYYLVDEEGNPLDPGPRPGGADPGRDAGPEGEIALPPAPGQPAAPSPGTPRRPPPGPAPNDARPAIPPAASEEFLRQATGRQPAPEGPPAPPR